MSLFQPDLCLLCHEPIVEEIGWSTIFSKKRGVVICEDCQNQLESIEGEKCELCDRPFERLDASFRHEHRCQDCVRWETDLEWAGCLQKNTSLYTYNEYMKEIIARYKYRGDYILINVFSQHLKLPEADHYVPIPLSAERLYERGFNQAEGIIKEAGYKSTHLLKRIHSEKQSKKSRSERIHLPQVFTINGNPIGSHILLVDDIYTTGSTLRHAAKLLLQAGAASVSSFTIARG